MLIQKPGAKIKLTNLLKCKSKKYEDFQAAFRIGCPLHAFSYILHKTFCNIACGGFEIAFCINADDRFCIAGAQMNPIIIEFYF